MQARLRRDAIRSARSASVMLLPELAEAEAGEGHDHDVFARGAGRAV